MMHCLKRFSMIFTFKHRPINDPNQCPTVRSRRSQPQGPPVFSPLMASKRK